MSNITQLSKAIRFALFAGAASVIAAPAFAQEEETTEDTAVLDVVEVTGSRLKRAAVEGALPVTVISRAELDASGDISVADYLRNTTFNSFGSFRPQSGSSAQSFAGLSLRGLGSSRTLILIDGRRAPVAPNVGSAQDLNTIPLAAVERIEILSDGASAIYGSDAIGGVVNVITRKDFNGVELSYGRGMPNRTGGDTESASVIFGASGERGRVLAGASLDSREIIFQRDRPWSRGGVSTFSNNLFNAILAPGTLYGYRPGGFVANPNWGSRLPGFGCNTDGFFTSGTGSTQRCFYDFTFVAADEAAVKNQSTFLRADYQINDDWTTYFNGSVTRVDSFGRYAPVPSSPWPGGSIFIPVNSPNHPAIRFPADGYDPNVPYFLRHRFAALGPRDTYTEANTYDFNLGFQGRIGVVDIDVGVRNTESRYIELGRNYVVGGIAQQLISSGAYDIYNPFNNPQSVLDSMIATINRDSFTKQEEVYAIGNFDLFEMGGGTAAMAIGAEYRTEDYADIYDTLQSSGQIVGSAGNSAFGDRSVKAAFFEVVFPFAANFEANLAGRYDKYSDYGNDFAPKLSLRWQPMDSLTLRASIGEGFRAPTLDLVSAQPAFSADTVTDPATCAAFGQPPTCSTQITAYSIANPNLFSEQSTQWSLGAAWDATDWLNMTVDYYNIEIEDRISSFSSGTIIACLRGAAILCPPGLSILPNNIDPPNPALGLGAAFGPAGEVLYVQRGSANLGTVETDGVDLNLRTQFGLGAWGDLRNQLQVSWVNDFSVDGGANIVDAPSVPEYRAVLQNVWTKGDFSVAWNVNHIADTKSTCGVIPDCVATYGYAARLSSWTTHDIQVTWSAPWNGRLTFGVNNVADKDPVLDPFDPTGRGFDFSLYDGYGRVPYFRYTQSF